MDTSDFTPPRNKTHVGEGLDELHRALKPFVRDQMTAAHGIEWRVKAMQVLNDVGDDFDEDPMNLLKLILKHYRPFATILKADGRTLISDLLNTRHHWAHHKFDIKRTFHVYECLCAVFERLKHDAPAISARRAILHSLVAQMAPPTATDGGTTVGSEALGRSAAEVGPGRDALGLPPARNARVGSGPKGIDFAAEEPLPRKTSRTVTRVVVGSLLVVFVVFALARWMRSVQPLDQADSPVDMGSPDLAERPGLTVQEQTPPGAAIAPLPSGTMIPPVVSQQAAMTGDDRNERVQAPAPADREELVARSGLGASGEDAVRSDQEESIRTNNAMAAAAELPPASGRPDVVLPIETSAIPPTTSDVVVDDHSRGTADERPTAAAERTGTMTTASHGFTFELEECRASGPTVRCVLGVTNQLSDREMMILESARDRNGVVRDSRALNARIPGTRAIDDAGAYAESLELKLAQYGVFGGTIVSGVRTTLVVVFDGVSAGARTLSVVDIGCSVGLRGGDATFTVQFRQVPLEH